MAIFLKVEAQESEQKLLNFIEKHCNAPKNEIHKWIRKGDVRVNKKRADAFDRISLGNEIRLPPFAELFKNTKENNKSKIDYTLEKVYEDADLLVINKKSGLAVQGGTGQILSLVDILNDQYPQSSFPPTPAHRLDKETSGLLLIAKSYTLLRELHLAFADKENANIKKYYLAKTSQNHNLAQDWQTWEDYLHIQKDPQGYEKTCIVNDTNAQYALSKARIHNQTQNIFEIKLITGRKHQIRAQASYRNMPILGDTKYGGEKANRLYLHSHKILWKGQEFNASIDW